ncbi:sterol desaturase family protein [Corallococcus sp. ZKHCc1 1396]|uniref:Sterol desaturase family protein n=1 Tax=Corallococcus soli TaxID=2710757 RepID=A0ABR9PVW6_9BACT|nr:MULTISPECIES: sterol desaturase family protein [Corallococcus]MBE4752078.1 sterol desaturase family protein [Corallococcus soli]MCY1030086.1 sterol desaturase family protein [Corallococcus sp. BB11-1]
MEPRPVPRQVQAFREEYRARLIGPGYQGWAHFAFTSLVCLTGIVLAVAQLESVRPWELLEVPGVFILANGVEFLGHRGPMHHKRRGLGLLFERHTAQHHRFFTHEAMAYDSPRDFKMVLFPPVLLLFFLGAVAAPLGALCFLLISANAGWLFVASAVAYYLAYEWVHFSTHLLNGHWSTRLPVVRFLRRHHQVHHDPSRMGRHNFNITFPLADWLVGTLWSREREKPPSAG